MINLFLQTTLRSNRISFKQSDKRNTNPAGVTLPTFTTDNDIFIKNDTTITPVKTKRSKTKRGRFLKQLKNITDPYCGSKILTEEEFERYKQTITPIKDPYSRIITMSHYSRHMRPIEKEMYIDFSKKLRKFEKEKQPGETLTFSQILQNEKPDAIKRLVEKEYNILNKIIDKTNEIPIEDAKQILSAVSIAITTIESEQERFKRKDFVDRIYNLRDKNPDKPYYQEVVKLANKLPTSENDKDAFIVKYAERTEDEITNRFVSSSVGNIEHIIPSSQGGSDEAFNFLLVSSGSNTERDIMDFEDYKQMHPKIERYTQMYIDDIINAIHNGELEGYEWYPYVVAPTIKENMGIDINLSNYKIKPKKAFKTLPERLQPYYPQYEKYFKKETK